MKTVSKKLLSLMLVAILLISAVPFQAFAAEPHDPANPTHTPAGWTSDATNHWQLCPEANCAEYTKELNKAAHTFDTNTGLCVTCNYACTHATQVDRPGTAIAATCVTAGKAADKECAACHKLMSTGAAIPATGVHTYVNGVCACGATEVGAASVLTLDAKGGTVNGGATMTLNVNKGSALSVLPDAVRPGYTFAGWFVGTTQLFVGGAYPFDTNQTAEAKWTEQTYQLTVRRVLNGDNSTAKTIHTVNVPIGTSVLNYLNANVYSLVTAELALNPGYVWENNYWMDFSGTQPLTSQANFMNQSMTIFVNFKAKTYNLFFNANGGMVTPTSKSVVFGQAVGTLPTPSKSGSVFQGWKDANNVVYTASTVYKVAGDTSLTAVWQDEALVILYVYVNGDFSSCNRMIVMDGFVKNNNISRDDVVAQLRKYYTASSGYLNVAGLFSEYGWSSYRANTGKAGEPNLQVTGSHPMKIYVMVTNANTGTTVLNGTTPNYNATTTIPGATNTTTNTTTNNGTAYWVSTGNGTGYWVYPNGTTTNTNSNPKTGDSAMIEAAAAIMVLAAGALVTTLSLRKRKMI